MRTNRGKRALCWIGLLPLFTFAASALAHAQGNGSSPAQPQTLTATQRDRLKDRDRFEQEAGKLLSAGKMTEALKAVEEMLAIEREVLGETSEDAIGSVKLSAAIQERREKWPEAIALRQSVLHLRIRRHGEVALDSDRRPAGLE